jgi:hypothetical protein
VVLHQKGATRRELAGDEGRNLGLVVVAARERGPEPAVDLGPSPRRRGLHLIRVEPVVSNRTEDPIQSV